MEKNYLEKLTLDWDSTRSNVDPDVEAVVLESLQPHIYLRELCIRGHGGPSCPTWLGDKLVVEALQSIDLSRVSWEYLPHLGKIWGLVKLTLKNIATMKEFVIEQSFCRITRLELIGLGEFEKWVSSQDTHHVFPVLQALIIRDCPKLLELPFSNYIVYPPDEDSTMDWLPKLQELEIVNCPELMLVPRIPWTETLHSVNIRDIGILGKFVYSTVGLEIVGKDGLQSLDEMLAFNKLSGLESLTLKDCPPLEWKDLLILTSLKTLDIECLDGLVGPLGGQGDVEWQHPLNYLVVQVSCDGKELTELLAHLPRLSKLNIDACEITQLSVRVDAQQTQSAAAVASGVEQENEEDGLLFLPSHLCDSLQHLRIDDCTELVLVDPPSTIFPARGGLQALRSLEELEIFHSPMILSGYSFSSPSCFIFPSSLQFLILLGVKGMRTLEPLSNLTNLYSLAITDCGEDLRCKGLGPLITTRGQLVDIHVLESPTFFVGWDPNPRRVQLPHFPPSSSSILKDIWTDEAMGLLTAPICSFLCSSLTTLTLYAIEMECFTQDQEDALHLLASLQHLIFWGCKKLQSFPSGLHKLTNLKQLRVVSCPAVRSLPKDGLPKSLQELIVWQCGNQELQQQCKGLVGTIPEIQLERGD
ncbi:hypothetical protein ZWY2020_057220 [Hordeum vulgare]|nr:hypothetical protein ZWY2020_057220 [Hordeum vulgare]